jgi:very-short-patch-repair endonuclease
MYRDQEQRDFARSLRNYMTEAEKRLWQLLRAGQLGGCKFRRQAAIGPYIVDFVCFSHKLVVELDGPQHAEEQAARHDARRTAWLTSQGFRVLRFRNHELDEGILGVVDAIRAALQQTGISPLPNHPHQGEGTGMR